MKHIKIVDFSEIDGMGTTKDKGPAELDLTLEELEDRTEFTGAGIGPNRDTPEGCVGCCCFSTVDLCF